MTDVKYTELFRNFHHTLLATHELYSLYVRSEEWELHLGSHLKLT